MTTLDRAWGLVTGRRVPAQLVVMRDGAVVWDRATRCSRDDLFWLFSAGKPYVAVTVRRLVEQGMINLDRPVASYWPEFGARGKSAITVREVLQHRSGLATTGNPLLDAVVMADLARSAARIQRARPRPLSAGHTAYGFLSFGVILGEVVRRVTGDSLAETVRRLVLEPLGVQDTYLGVPSEALSRTVPLEPGDVRFGAATAFCNRTRVRQTPIPSAGFSSTARDLATFYETLRRGGCWEKRRILEPRSVEAMLVPTGGAHRDGLTGTYIRWTEGFQLGGPRVDPAEVSALGGRSAPTAFGHNGSGVCLGWADPTRGLVMAYLTACLGGLQHNLRHMAAVSDAVLAWADDSTRPAPSR